MILALLTLVFVCFSHFISSHLISFHLISSSLSISLSHSSAYADGKFYAFAELRRAENVLDKFWRERDHGLMGRLIADFNLSHAAGAKLEALRKARESEGANLLYAVLCNGAPKTQALLQFLSQKGA